MTEQSPVPLRTDSFPVPDVLSANCPSRAILNHLTSRWGVLVLIVLQEDTHRFSALRRRIDGISERMLTQTLKNLETDGLVRRKSYDTVPPHVEYSLTPLGREAAAKVYDLTYWIESNLKRLLGKEA